jgi:hypothetical protein
MPKFSPKSYTKRRWTSEDARAALDAQARSGLSPRSFAQREGIDPQRLTRWARRIGGTSTSSSSRTERKARFVEIDTRPAAVVEIVLPSGVVVRVDARVEPATLRRIVAALDGAAC